MKTHKTENKELLRDIWSKYFRLDWKLGATLILIFSIIRFVIVLNSNLHTGSNTILYLFLSMWFIPVILLTRKGRKQIGIHKPDKLIKLLYSLTAGMLFCVVTYLITYWLFDYSVNNSFVYMSRIYGISAEMLATHRHQLFYISLIISMTLSPIGEELFYRGIIHQSFVSKYGENRASIIDSLAFMVVHLAHFGIIYDLGRWSFPLFSALLWMIFMYSLSRLFYVCKIYSRSIWGAVFCHAGYNCVMMYIIYFYIL